MYVSENNVLFVLPCQNDGKGATVTRTYRQVLLHMQGGMGVRHAARAWEGPFAAYHTI